MWKRVKSKRFGSGTENFTRTFIYTSKRTLKNKCKTKLFITSHDCNIYISQKTNQPYIHNN